MTFYPPRFFGVTKIDEFIKQATFVFGLEGKKIPDFELDLSNIQTISLAGQLLIYKFIGYSAEKHCFASPRLLWNPDGKLVAEFRSSGFEAIMNNYINNASREKLFRSYKELKISTRNNYLIAPQRLLRTEESSRTLLEQYFISKVNSFYEPPKVKKLVTRILCETLTNFWSHATDDSGTVIVARGNKNSCEIVCADNGQGVITSLRKAYPDWRKRSSEQVFEKAFEKGVTSKPGKYHLGYGLWIIKELVRRSGGQFRLISEGFTMSISPKRFKLAQCGYWKGTIAAIQVQLGKACTLVDLPELSDGKDLSINWG